MGKMYLVTADKEKSQAELKAERDLLMARAAIKHAVMVFAKNADERPTVDEDLQKYWDSLDNQGWKEHLAIFSTEVKKYKQVVVKKILFDLDHYIKDCKKLVSDFKRSKEEILLMVAIGKIEPDSFVQNLQLLPSNREKLDRKIHKQIKELDWQDDLALIRLDELTDMLDKEKIKKSEIEEVESEIKMIEEEIQSRKSKRDALAIKLVEWKTRGNIDIAGEDGEFRLEA